jgi:protein-S-isoprenylcysteine O-methyltransferase Ste14
MLSLLFGLWAITSIRLRNFRVLPDPRRNAVLVTRGPYRWIRHPMYTALLVYTLAQTIDAAVLTNWIAWGVLLIDLVLKLRYEERELLNRFPDYGADRKRTKKLAPGVW